MAGVDVGFGPHRVGSPRPQSPMPGHLSRPLSPLPGYSSRPLSPLPGGYNSPGRNSPNRALEAHEKAAREMRLQMDPVLQLRAGAAAALAGNPSAQRWLESASCIDVPGPTLVMLWDAAWALVTDLTVEENVRYMVVVMVKKAVQIRWARWPLAAREDLYAKASTALFTLATNLGPNRQHWSVVLRQLASVVGLMTLCVEGEDEPVRRLVKQAMEFGGTRDLTLLWVALLLLREVADETISGNRIGKKAALGVMDLVDNVVTLAGGTWEEMLMSSGQIQLDIQSAFMCVACECLSKWARINGMRWDQVENVAKLAQATLQNGPVLHVLYVRPSNCPIQGTEPPKLVECIAQMIESVLQHTPDPAQPCMNGPSSDFIRQTAVDTLADALLGYEGPSNEDVSRCLIRAAAALMRSQPAWVAKGERRQQGLLDWLLRGTGRDDVVVSTICLETWLHIHKVPWSSRMPQLQVSMYQQLLPVLVRRACRPTDIDELLGEEEWERFIEHSLAPVLAMCYQVLRSEYARTVLNFLQPFTNRSSTMTAQEVEAIFLSLRAVATELSQRALLALQDDHSALVAAAKSQSSALGFHVTEREVAADAEASHAVVSDLCRTVVHLRAHVPAFLQAPYAVREAVTLLGRLNAWLGVNSFDARMVQQLTLTLLQLLPVAPARMAAAETFNLIVSRHPGPLREPAVFETLTTEFELCLQNGFPNGSRLAPEDASAIMQALCGLALSYDYPNTANAAMQLLCRPVLDRLDVRIGNLARGSQPILPESVALQVATDLTVVAAMVKVSAGHSLAPGVFEETWKVVSTVAATALVKNEAVTDALFEVLGRALRLAEVMLENAKDKAAEKQAIEVLDAACTLAHSLSGCCPSGYMLFLTHLSETWGPVLEQQHLKGPGDSDMDAALTLFGTLVARAMELVTVATANGQTFTSVDAATVLLDCMGGAMACACPTVLVEMGEPFRLCVEMAVSWVDQQPAQLFTQHAVRFLSSVLSMAERAESAGNGNEAVKWLWAKRILPARDAALTPQKPLLTYACAKAVLGDALEADLDGFAELMRMIVVHGGEVCVDVLKQALDTPPACDQPEIVKLRGPLLEFVGRRPVPGLCEFKEFVTHTWGYCQGRNGLDALNAPNLRHDV